MILGLKILGWAEIRLLPEGRSLSGGGEGRGEEGEEEEGMCSLEEVETPAFHPLGQAEGDRKGAGQGGGKSCRGSQLT